MPGALDGITILDLSRVLAGPWATQLLADLGAEVIKIERPGEGDDTRHWGPPYVESGDGEDREAAYFLSANRGKKSVCIDFTRSEGQSLIRGLAASSDILVENFRVGGLAKYGLDYESLRSTAPDLVYCSITGFGQDGPYAHRPGYDFLIQGMSGLMSITGQPDGAPTKVGVAVSDILTGLYASNAILAALRHRDCGGGGQHLDIALLDVQIAALANQALNYLATGNSPGRLGNAHPNIVPYQAIETADHWITIAVGNDGQFRRFCEVIALPGMADDARFATNARRVANRDVLIPLVQTAMLEQKAACWLERLERAGVPAGPINELEQMFDDPHVRFREMHVDLPHSRLDQVPSVACPIKLSATPALYDRGPPMLGEQSREVLAERLGLGPIEIERLIGQGIVG